MERNPGNNIAVSLSGDDADELRGYWEKVSDGGTVSVPLEEQMWGDEFGMCMDAPGGYRSGLPSYWSGRSSTRSRSRWSSVSGGKPSTSALIRLDIGLGVDGAEIPCGLR
jgi:hypothetical protein